MKIKTNYNFQETCILCALQCQELGATGRQLSFKLCCSRDTARTMYQCISNNYQYPKYILSYLMHIFATMQGRTIAMIPNYKHALQKLKFY